jgi:hypothetical protein
MQRQFEIALLNIQDVKVVVVFLEGRPDPPGGLAQYAARHFAALEDSAAQAGLNGNIVAVWADEFGRTRFLAPPEQRAFFQIVDYDQLRAQISGILRLPEALG